MSNHVRYECASTMELVLVVSSVFLVMLRSTYKLIKSFLINYLADQNRVDCPNQNGSNATIWRLGAARVKHYISGFMLHVT